VSFFTAPPPERPVPSAPPVVQAPETPPAIAQPTPDELLKLQAADALAPSPERRETEDAAPVPVEPNLPESAASPR